MRVFVPAPNRTVKVPLLRFGKLRRFDMRVILSMLMVSGMAWGQAAEQVKPQPASPWAGAECGGCTGRSGSGPSFCSDPGRDQGSAHAQAGDLHEKCP